MSSYLDQCNADDAYMRLEKARAATEAQSSASMEAQHVMEGLMNAGMKLGRMLLGIVGSCAGCSGM